MIGDNLLTDNDFFEESLIINLYYLRSLRDYCTRIELSLPLIYEEARKKANELSKKCEGFLGEIVKLADNNIIDFFIESEIIVTKYTLDCELLTEKLFGIDIDTNLTEKELALKTGNVNPTSEMLLNMEKINTEALNLSQEFLEFANNLYEKTTNQESFTYYYNSLNIYMIEEIKTYVSALERLEQKTTTSPSYVIENEYWFNSFLLGIASYLRGEIDPIYVDTFKIANDFVQEYKNILDEYDNMTITIENQKNMTLNSLELARRFKKFLEDCINKLLKKELYFISAPITKDNALSAVNYFIYNLLKTEYISEDNL